MDQETLIAVDNAMRKTELMVFFHKLASYGIVPSTEEQREALLIHGNELLAQYPFLSEDGPSIKVACATELGSACEFLDNGFTKEAGEYVDELMKNQHVAAAVSMLLAAQSI